MWHQQEQQQYQAGQQPMIVVVMPQDQQQQQQSVSAQYQQQYEQRVETQPVHHQYTQQPQLHQQVPQEQYGQAGVAHSAYGPAAVPAQHSWQQHPWHQQQQAVQQQQQQPPHAHAWHQQSLATSQQSLAEGWQQHAQQQTGALYWQSQHVAPLGLEPSSRGPPHRWQQQQQQQRQWGQQGVRQPGGRQQQQQPKRPQQGGKQHGRQPGGQQQQQRQKLQQQPQGKLQRGQQQQQQQPVHPTGLGRRPLPQDTTAQGQKQAKRQRMDAQNAQRPGQQALVQQQQQQAQRPPGSAIAAPGFNYQEWQQESERWQSQLQQKRGSAGQGKAAKNKQLQRQHPQQQQQQQQQAQAQQQAQGDAQKLGKKARKTLKKQQAQKDNQPEELQPQFPILRLPPKVTAAVASYLTAEDKIKLAELLPEDSAATAVLRRSVHKFVTQQPKKPPRYVDVPGSIQRLRALEELSMCLWMDGKIQARTGLAQLSALHRLTSLKLSIDVAPELANNRKLGGKGKQGDAAVHDATTAQQLEEALQEASVQVQEDLWQITAALGRLTNLKHLHMNCSQYSVGRSRDIFKHIGYQAFAQISGLTGLENLTLTYSVCQAGSGLESLSGLSSLTKLSLEETGAGGSLIAGKQRFYLQPDQEAGVAALGQFWRNAKQLRSVRLRTPYLGPDAVVKFAVQPSLQVLDVSGCRLLFPRFRTTFEQLTALQELHASGCEGLTAADLATAAAHLSSSLTFLDVSRNSKQNDGGVMQGSIAAIGQLTSLRHLNAYGTGIAAGAGGSGAGGSGSGAVCALLSSLQQLTFLSLGSVHRDIMTIALEDTVHLAALTNLSTLHLHGAPLGTGLSEPGVQAGTAKSQEVQRESDLKAAITARLEFLKPLSGLTSLRLWACRFSHINRDRVQGIARLLLNHRKLSMKKHDVLDSKWYPGEEQPAEYSGDEAEGTAGSSNVAYRSVLLD